MASSLFFYPYPKEELVQNLGIIGRVIGIENDLIIAREGKESENNTLLKSMMFVKMPMNSDENAFVIGRVVNVVSSHEFPREKDVVVLAGEIMNGNKKMTTEFDAKLFTRLVIDPLGLTHQNGIAAEYRGGIKLFAPVYPALDEDIQALYPDDHSGLPIGKITSGLRPSPVWFRLGRTTALQRHIAVFGKSGSGKTTLLKWIVMANLEQEFPLPMLIFGHPDLALDNPNHAGSKGLLSLQSPNIVPVGYDKPMEISPRELTFQDLTGAFDEMSGPQRDFWHYMFSNYQDECIDTLASYNINDDPLTLRRHQIKDPNDAKCKITVGIANSTTIDACCRQARQLSRLINNNASNTLNEIMAHIKRGATVLVNTFDLSDFHQGILVKIILNRLVRAGKESMHKKAPMEALVLIDEAQHFIGRAGEAIGEFCREARKFGVTLGFLTQSPCAIPQNIAGQLSTTIAFHMNRQDLKGLDETAPRLSELRPIIAAPPLKDGRGVALVQAEGYPYPAVIKVPLFENVLDKYLQKKQAKESEKKEGE